MCHYPYMTTCRRWFREHQLLGRAIVGIPFAVGVVFLGTFLTKFIGGTLGIESNYPAPIATGVLILGLFFGLGYLMDRYAGKR